MNVSMTFRYRPSSPTANSESPLVRRPFCFVNSVFPKMRSKGMVSVGIDCRAQTLRSCLYEYGNTDSVSHNSHDTFWLWLSVKFPVLDQIQQTKINSSQGKFGWWLPPLLIFPVVHFSLGGTEERRDRTTWSSKWVTAVLGHQRRSHLHPVKSVHSLEVLQAESHLLLQV